MDKEFYDKYSKELHCAECFGLETCIKENSPYLTRCRNFIQNEKIKQLEQEIGDLEAKLAESDEYRELLLEEKAGYLDLISGYADKCKELKQQLQEEKNRNKKLNHEAQKYYEDAYCNGFQNKKAIAELEKVKEWANNMYYGWKSNDGVNLDAKTGICNTLQAVCGMVNQQIKSLKGE